MPVAGSCVGVPAHATSSATTANGRKRQARVGIVFGAIAEGVLFTNGGRILPARTPGMRGGRHTTIAASTIRRGERNLAKPNFGYQKRQKELEKKRKKEEKKQKKLDRAAAESPAPEPGATDRKSVV